jgi:tRNA pseudouridine32 synthase/23S rRNA pseudouridine746 synthase
LSHINPPLFNYFKTVIETDLIPDYLILQKENHAPHPLSLLAAVELQQHILSQTDWEHNFGLASTSNSNVVGKNKAAGLTLIIRSQITTDHISVYQ